MELSQAFVPRAEFKDYRKMPTNQHFHADVVIIDRSTTGAAHQVYQLKAEYLNFYEDLLLLRQEFTRLNRDAFIVLGDLLKIEMSKKVIALTNNNIISYKYLLLFNGIEQPIELETALHTLKDALLIEATKIKDRLNLEPALHATAHTYSIPLKATNIGKVAQPCMNQSADAMMIDLGATARSLCQVQI